MKHFLQNHLRLLLLVSASLFLNACNPVEPQYNCTAVMTQSIALTASDSDNKPIEEFAVSYRINDGEVQNAVCNAAQPCLPVYEASGKFAITVSKVGYLPTSLNVTVTRNECHVNTETIVAKLKFPGIG
jgi:hypothetical protein